MPRYGEVVPPLPPFVKARELYETDERFNILSVRLGKGQFGPLVRFEIAIESTGEIRTLTLASSDFRMELVDKINNGLASGEPVGPVVIVQIKSKEYPNAAWAFADPDAVVPESPPDEGDVPPV